MCSCLRISRLGTNATGVKAHVYRRMYMCEWVIQCMSLHTSACMCMCVCARKCLLMPIVCSSTHAQALQRCRH